MRDLSQTLSTTNSQKKTHHKISTLQVNLILTGMITVLGLVYLFSINSLATEGFRIKQLSTQIAKLEDDHKDLELQNSTLQSVSNIQQQSALLNFVPATNVTYIKDDSFALK